VVKVALGEAAAASGLEPTPLLVAIDSDIPIGSGFGSSAACAVAVVAGCLAHAGAEPDRAVLDGLVLEVERRQHGLPSGVDHATVIRGGLLWARRGDDGTASIEPLAPSSSLLPALRIFDSGPPAEPTGAVVAAVRDRIREPTLDRMETATRLFRGQVESPRHDPHAVVALVREFEACLEELGVVPAPLAGIIRRIEAGGGAAKVSGAGALSGSSAGGVLVYHPDAEAADLDRLTRGLRELRVRPGAEGLMVETGR
jgi:mevalonate kinase